MKKSISLTGIIVALMIAGLIGWAGSQGGSQTSWGPLFLLCGLIAFTVQWAFFVPAFIYQTEHYFDLTGSLTYITLSLIVIVASGFSEPRTLLIGTLVIIWAGRLGSFLFKRVKTAGQDTRFRSIKPDFLQFLMTWTLQGLWVFITFAAGLAAMTSGREAGIDIFAMVGAGVWIAGFGFEVLSDRQKTAFRQDENNRGRFISTGVWSWSRHPNYFGEIVLWVGIAIIAFPVLEGWQLATLISPIFVVVLLTKISGVRMLENQGRKRWGEDPDYQAYLARTSVLVPLPPKSNA